MDDNQLDDMLRDWANDNSPTDDKRNEILKSVFEQKLPITTARQWLRIAVLSGIGVVAATVFLAMFLSREISVEPNLAVDLPQPLRISLLVLRKIPGSESAVEFLEDTVFVAESQKLNEIEINGHRLFLWIYPLEKSLYALDVGIDKTAETGIVVVPDKTQAVNLQSNGDRFDVFVSVLPKS